MNSREWSSNSGLIFRQFKIEMLSYCYGKHFRILRLNMPNYCIYAILTDKNTNDRNGFQGLSYIGGWNTTFHSMLLPSFIMLFS